MDIEALFCFISSIIALVLGYFYTTHTRKAILLYKRLPDWREISDDWEKAERKGVVFRALLTYRIFKSLKGPGKFFLVLYWTGSAGIVAIICSPEDFRLKILEIFFENPSE